MSRPPVSGGERSSPEIRTTAPVAVRGEPSAPPPGEERRREARLTVVEDRLWIEWRAGEEYLGGSGRLVNVSRHGALIVAGAPFRENQDLRIFLEDPAPHVGVSATVLSMIAGKTGMNQYRLRFLKSCPDAFLDAAVNGFESWMRKGQAAG